MLGVLEACAQEAKGGGKVGNFPVILLVFAHAS